MSSELAEHVLGEFLSMSGLSLGGSGGWPLAVLCSKTGLPAIVPVYNLDAAHGPGEVLVCAWKLPRDAALALEWASYVRSWWLGAACTGNEEQNDLGMWFADLSKSKCTEHENPIFGAKSVEEAAVMLDLRAGLS